MTQQLSGVVSLALLFLAAGGYVVWRIKVGSSFFHPPPMRVFRASDPFSFWLSLLPPAVVAIGAGAFLVCGLLF
jgi:hypothetical protein